MKGANGGKYTPGEMSSPDSALPSNVYNDIFFFHKMKKFIFVKHWEMFGYGKLLQCQEFI